MSSALATSDANATANAWANPHPLPPGLRIETFSNKTGGNSFFKAIGHPLAAEASRKLVRMLEESGPVAIYDPAGLLETFNALFPLDNVDLLGVFVQDVEKIGALTIQGQVALPITALTAMKPRTILVMSYEASRVINHIRHLIPGGAALVDISSTRLPDAMVTDSKNYLSGLNFATNFAFFRDAGGHHTRVVTANYWSAYGAKAPHMWLRLIDENGETLAEWTEDLPAANGSVVIDSRDVRARFNLPEFTGQLFLHVIGGAGHDVVKYALDTFSDDGQSFSCTHDANSWPADLYAGLPAPREDEQVILWIQNSHPVAIPAGAIGLNLMGREYSFVPLNREIPPFCSYALDVTELHPQARWPEQFEFRAGKYVVRPRYEIQRQNGRRRISHPNVQRTDLVNNPHLAELGALIGKGYILPAPILPTDRYRTFVLPTPMSTAQTFLPFKASIYDASGEQVAEHHFGNLPRYESVAIEITDLLAQSQKSLSSGYGHIELTYDFEAGTTADGWMHALFRFDDMKTGHTAETSFGSHVFNTVLTYRNEPQSYAGRPPGLSTRLFLRLGEAPFDTLCHLMYPASTPWHSRSETALILHNAQGQEVASRTVYIPCSGSYLFRASKVFTESELGQAGANSYVLIRDTTCRLFGYHGLANGDSAFSLDHMFGF